MRILPVLAATLLLGAAPAEELRLERVVLVMRHGVRPPTKAPAMAPGTAANPWPSWEVPPGNLTMHGARAIAAIGGADRTVWRAAGLLPASGCAPMRLVSSSSQRTIATAQHYAAALQPGCSHEVEHKAEGARDPRFAPIDRGLEAMDSQATQRAVLAAAGPGGLAGVEARLRPALARLDAILCNGAPRPCGVGDEPSGLEVEADARPKLTGALDRASTAAHILLLEYADAKPLAEVGWGRASAADIERLGVFHATEFALLARPRYLAARNLAGLMPLIREALTDPKATTVTLISGHDTNVANLAGLLDLHWQIPGFAADDPTPGGAIILERLRDTRGRRYVRASYRSQTLEGIRAASGTVVRQPLALPGCAARGVSGLCEAAAFEALLRARLKG